MPAGSEVKALSSKRLPQNHNRAGTINMNRESRLRRDIANAVPGIT